MSIKTKIENTVHDLVIDFMDEDRRDDENLWRGEIESAISEGKISPLEIVEAFRKTLFEYLEE